MTLNIQFWEIRQHPNVHTAFLRVAKRSKTPKFSSIITPEDPVTSPVDPAPGVRNRRGPSRPIPETTYVRGVPIGVKRFLLREAGPPPLELESILNELRVERGGWGSSAQMTRPCEKTTISASFRWKYLIRVGAKCFAPRGKIARQSDLRHPRDEPFNPCSDESFFGFCTPLRPCTSHRPWFLYLFYFGRILLDWVGVEWLARVSAGLEAGKRQVEKEVTFAS